MRETRHVRSASLPGRIKLTANLPHNIWISSFQAIVFIFHPFLILFIFDLEKSTPLDYKVPKDRVSFCLRVLLSYHSEWNTTNPFLAIFLPSRSFNSMNSDKAISITHEVSLI